VAVAKKKRGPGRPKHVDDPPAKLGTTIPQSVVRLLDRLTAQMGQPRSEVVAAALRAYAKQVNKIR
jgi:metal-responsive CopG/Arc/MetJ family transcriptional regulator